jgi:hypothetical protein
VPTQAYNQLQPVQPAFCSGSGGQAGGGSGATSSPLGAASLQTHAPATQGSQAGTEITEFRTSVGEKALPRHSGMQRHAADAFSVNRVHGVQEVRLTHLQQWPFLQICGRETRMPHDERAARDVTVDETAFTRQQLHNVHYVG